MTDAAPAPAAEAVKDVAALLDHIGAVEPDVDAVTMPPADQSENEHDDTSEGERDGGTGGSDDVEASEPATADVMAEDSEGGEEGDAGGDDADPITVVSLAKELGVEAADIYNELTIPLGEGESVTLGEWKDRVKDLRELDQSRTAYEADKADYEKGQMRDRALLTEMLDIIGPDAARPALEAAKQRLQGWEDEQRGLILEAIPEWKDPDALAKDREAIVALGAEYGHTEQEMVYVKDARTVRMLRDFAALKAEMAELRTNAKKKTSLPGRKGSGNRNSKSGALAKRLQKATQSTDSRIKAGGIGELLVSEGLS